MKVHFELNDITIRKPELKAFVEQISTNKDNKDYFYTNLGLLNRFTSLSSEKDCDEYIDKTFARLKSENKIRLKTERFKFVHTNANIVEKLIQNLNSTSGAGFSEIPSKVIKNSNSIIAPILTSLFNHCIDLRKFPKEWKSAIATPLYKSKGVKSDVNNYRGNSQ